jgi:uncharacterized GH25 family protein
MKKFFLLTAIIVFFSQVSFAQNVTISTSPVAASNISQGSTNNIVYIARMWHPFLLPSMPFSLHSQAPMIITI